MSTKRWLLFVLLLAPMFAQGQAAPSNRGRNGSIYVGGALSAFKPDYGNNTLLGPTVYVDYDWNRWLGAEGEARWLRFNQIYGIHEDNYLAGPRVTYVHHKFRPYAKFLFGAGEFNFPTEYHAHGGYTNYTFGGGLDYRASRKVRIRLFDYEFQKWPKFNGGTTNDRGLTPNGFSFGASYRVW